MSVIGLYCIVRSRDQGVVCGVVETVTPMPGGLACAVVREASQVHGWSNGANTLFEAANRGFGNARISEPAVNPVTIYGVCGVLPCTPEAEANLRQHRWNKPYASSGSRPRATRTAAT